MECIERSEGVCGWPGGDVEFRLVKQQSHAHAINLLLEPCLIGNNIEDLLTNQFCGEELMTHHSFYHLPPGAGLYVSGCGAVSASLRAG